MHNFITHRSTPDPASTQMWAGKLPGYVTSHQGQLSLAIHPWVGAMSTSKSSSTSRHAIQSTNPYQWSRSVNWCLETDLVIHTLLRYICGISQQALYAHQRQKSQIPMNLMTESNVDVFGQMVHEHGKSTWQNTQRSTELCKHLVVIPVKR